MSSSVHPRPLAQDRVLRVGGRLIRAIGHCGAGSANRRQGSRRGPRLVEERAAAAGALRGTGRGGSTVTSADSSGFTLYIYIYTHVYMYVYMYIYTPKTLPLFLCL